MPFENTYRKYMSVVVDLDDRILTIYSSLEM